MQPRRVRRTAIVIGAGVVGVCSARELAKLGYDVTIVDAADTVAAGASFGNSGLISPRLWLPFASPQTLKSILVAMEEELHDALRRAWQVLGLAAATRCITAAALFLAALVTTLTDVLMGRKRPRAAASAKADNALPPQSSSQLLAPSGAAELLPQGPFGAAESLPQEVVEPPYPPYLSVTGEMAATLGFWRFGLQWLRACFRHARRNSPEMRVAWALSCYSLEALKEVCAEEGIAAEDFDFVENGLLEVYLDEGKLATAASKAVDLTADGFPASVLGHEDVLKREPFLRSLSRGRIAGGVLMLGDSTGDSYFFTRALADVIARRYGVRFLLGTSVSEFIMAPAASGAAEEAVAAAAAATDAAPSLKLEPEIPSLNFEQKIFAMDVVTCGANGSSGGGGGGGGGIVRRRAPTDFVDYTMDTAAILQKNASVPPAAAAAGQSNKPGNYGRCPNGCSGNGGLNGFNAHDGPTGGCAASSQSGNGRKIAGLMTSGGVLTADVYVVAAGAASGRLLEAAGVPLPMMPFRGYAMTLRVPADTPEELLPRGIVIDAVRKTKICRMRGPDGADTVRLVSFGEVVANEDFGANLTPACVDALRRSAARFCGALGEEAIAAAEVWAGGRPCTPDGLPVVSATKLSNLYVNAGHAAHGWKLACSTAKVLASAVEGDDGKLLPEALEGSLEVLSVGRFDPTGAAAAKKAAP